MAKNDDRKIAIYSRKSLFTGKGESIENQISMCKQYIKSMPKYNGNIDDDDIIIYEDENFSGYYTERPQYQAMINDIKSKKIAIIVCYRLDRLSRNVIDFCNLKEILDKYNVDFISINERFDTTTPGGEAMLYMSSVFAQLERNTLAERVRDNMIELSKSGRWLGGSTPLGYKSIKLDKKNINGKKINLYALEIDEKEIELVRIIFTKFLETKSMSKLTAYMLENQFKTRNGVDFSRWSLKAILQNPVYAIADVDVINYFKKNNADVYVDIDDVDGKTGLMSYNKREQNRRAKTTKMKDVSEWIISLGKHEGIISGKRWVEIQEQLEINGHKTFQSTKNNALCSGILKCGVCGGPMYPKIRKDRNYEGELKFEYLCHMKTQSKKSRCNGKNANGNLVDKLVKDTIKSLSHKNSKFYKAIKELATTDLLELNNPNDEIKVLEMSYRKNQAIIETLLDRIKYIDIELLDSIQNEIKEVRKRNEEIEEKLKLLNRCAPNVINDKETAKIILELLEKQVSRFDDLDLATRRNLLKIFTGSIVIDGDKLIINLIGDKDYSPLDNNEIRKKINEKENNTIACSIRNNDVLRVKPQKNVLLGEGGKNYPSFNFMFIRRKIARRNNIHTRKTKNGLYASK